MNPKPSRYGPWLVFHDGHLEPTKDHGMGKIGVPMRFRIGPDGRPASVLTGYKGRKLFRLNRLVAAEFCPQPTKSRNCLRHIDGDKTNCAANNLYWATRRECLVAGGQTQVVAAKNRRNS